MNIQDALKSGQIYGDATDISGDATGIRGIVSGIVGNVTRHQW